LFLREVAEETAELILDLLSRGVSVTGIAAREAARRSRPEMAPQHLEKIESAPEMVWARKPRTYKIWYPGRVPDRPR
jgi:hypothetical protein